MKCKKLGNHTISYQSLLLSTTVLNDKFKMLLQSLKHVNLDLRTYGTAHFKLDDTRVQQLHGSTRFQKRPQHFPRAHDRPMTYYHWKLHACMHDTFVLLACVA